jgi:MFS transporter, NNP family, nitrate/nitrite transporter
MSKQLDGAGAPGSRHQADPAASPRPARPWVMLGLATVGFAVNFWAWALLSPLGPQLKDSLHLSTVQQSLVVAVPVVVGSLGRIPVGALTDRFGGRVMFPLISACTIAPVLFLGLAGHSSLAALLAGGLFLGIGGTAFAVGVPFVNAWFPPQRRGLAIGIFGAGMGGTAISALTTVKLVSAHGMAAPFLLTAAMLAVYAVGAAVVLRDAPGRVVPSGPLGRRLASTARLAITWQAGALYAVVFGGYVAFSVYLPTYLKTAYGLAQADAANRMAGFVLLAVAARPAGGWLSDRFGPARVLTAALAVVTVGAAGQAFTPSLAPAGTVAFLAMAAALGAGSGAVFALVAQQSPPTRVGSVAGIVGAAGGLGGFVPPLVMGVIFSSYGSYAAGLALLAAVAAAAMVFTATTVRRATRRPVTATAAGHTG